MDINIVSIVVTADSVSVVGLKDQVLLHHQPADQTTDDLVRHWTEMALAQGKFTFTAVWVAALSEFYVEGAAVDPAGALQHCYPGFYGDIEAGLNAVLRLYADLGGCSTAQPCVWPVS